MVRCHFRVAVALPAPKFLPAQIQSHAEMLSKFWSENQCRDEPAGGLGVRLSSIGDFLPLATIKAMPLLAELARIFVSVDLYGAWDLGNSVGIFVVN